jgi:hypothetical protein
MQVLLNRDMTCEIEHGVTYPHCQVESPYEFTPPATGSKPTGDIKKQTD